MKQPWQQGPLDQWAICGMNHYHVAGKRYLFVSMTKGGKCITEEGADDEYLWNRLWHKAVAINCAERAARQADNVRANRPSGAAQEQPCKTM
jgi:hypothetical protein